MILIVGATGVVGGMISQRLLEQGREVRILVRRDSLSSQLVQQGLAASVEELIEAGAQPVHGDLRDRASLDGVVEGIEAVITTANSAMRGGAALRASEGAKRISPTRERDRVHDPCPYIVHGSLACDGGGHARPARPDGYLGR
jgi:uncharacterized protein YbjT (DUF2867 family)